MINIVRKFLSIIAVMACVITVANTATAAEKASVANTEIGDYGTWATETNRQLLLDTITTDIDEFYVNSSNISSADFVPIEAKVGMSFMNSFSYISHVLNGSLTQFIKIFIIIMFGFWLALESITLIQNNSKPAEKLKEILKKSIIVVIWLAVLDMNPVKLFEFVISPILYIATLISDTVLNGAANIIGTEMLNTCDAIKNYVSNNLSQNNILDASTATNIMCISTRLSSFAYTAIDAGWEWVKYGIGNSGFVFICGIGLIALFLYMLWQFAFMAFGVIADLFLTIIMLPFTAVNETLGKTTYKGIIGNIFNEFLKLFATESLKSQVQRFIDAALHFIVLSVVVVICMALLSMISFEHFPDIDDTNFWVTILLAGVVGYLAKNASKIADEIGGKINTELGDQFKSETQKVFSGMASSAKSWWKVLRKK